MNGDEIVQKFSERITILETKMDERWTAHRKHSDEKWGTVQEEVANIFARLGELTCKEQRAKVEWLTWSVRILWMLLITGGILRGVIAIAGVVK